MYKWEFFNCWHAHLNMYMHMWYMYVRMYLLNLRELEFRTFTVWCVHTTSDTCTQCLPDVFCCCVLRSTGQGPYEGVLAGHSGGGRPLPMRMLIVIGRIFLGRAGDQRTLPFSVQNVGFLLNLLPRAASDTAINLAQHMVPMKLTGRYRRSSVVVRLSSVGGLMGWVGLWAMCCEVLSGVYL